MENEVQVVEKKVLSANDIKAQVQLIQQVMSTVMKKDVHYGAVPGCGAKYTLLKPGAEKIMATFRIACEPIVEDLSSSDEARYRVTAKMITRDGASVGSGIGECSSNETKYMWRKAVCNEEFEETPIDRRQDKWKSGYGDKPNYKVKQVRMEIADVANTVLKMAKKRALIDGVLTATGASDIFAQDLEDGFVPNNMPVAGKPEVKSPQSKPAKGTPKTESESRTSILEMLEMMSNGDPIAATNLLDNYTAFKGKEGNQVAGIKDVGMLKGKRLEVTHSKIKKEFDEMSA